MAKMAKNEYLFDRYIAQNIVIHNIYNQYNTLIDRVIKKIKNQIKKDPLKRYYEININNYSPKEMKIIKTFFEYKDFKIEFYKPVDDMVSHNYYTISAGTTTVSSTIASSNESLRSKFYIVW